ncbi:hypothetical protein [Mesorhizobium sp. B2-3-5]|uniref:hypothetical protein n=1 Tax=Mesorhizobium sp. B2-3-5 TaxID=2589958 RepID=UPI001126B9CD|nr:hypothetical protein [Mesorhizobium sp. B2-3-5]TPM28719.1 hypothetical protein FJ958_16410 [Mesorhizobium sp. B2-3-5]
MVIFFHGEGDKRIGATAFTQLTKDSDRAAGVVAASIVEQRLAECLQSRFPKGDLSEKLAAALFHSSAALGSFSAKINVGYLFGYISAAAQTDLQNMKEIRNRFAHRTDIDSFSHPEIKSRCENLKLVDNYVKDEHPPNSYAVGEPESGVLMAFPGASEQLKDPRERYITSAMVFNFFLGATEMTGWSRPDGPVI